MNQFAKKRQDEGKKQLQMWIDPELHKKFRVIAAINDETLEQTYIRAFEAFVDSYPQVKSLVEVDEGLHDATKAREQYGDYST